MSFLVDNDGVNPPKITEIPDPMPTHAELVAAAESARADPFLERGEGDVGWSYDWAEERNQAIDVLLAILDLHDDISCEVHCAYPCWDREIVVNALRKMDAL